MDILLEEIHSGIIKFFEMFQQIVIKFPYLKKKKKSIHSGNPIKGDFHNGF